MAQRSLQENCEPCSTSTDVETARRFFSGISDDAADTEHLIAIRTLLDRATRWFTDPDAADGFHTKLPKPVSGWTDSRDLPAMAERPFHRIWDEIKNDPNDEHQPQGKH